ncbi:hypothetical protein FRC10_009325 [Ceratobasidium sp. 414]|nr:hypothetical protein FRC10_009325 [Ceratobasidium sp. 414]
MLGQLPDLDGAIVDQRNVVAATPVEHPNMPKFVVTLGNSHGQTRFDYLGDLTDLKKAAKTRRAAVLLSKNGATHSISLGSSLVCRFDTLGDISDLHEAIDCLELLNKYPLAIGDDRFS